MKRILVIAMISILAVASFTGCGKATSEAVSTSDNAAAAPLTGDTIETSCGTIILGDYNGLKAERYVYTVAEDDIDTEVDNLISDHTEDKDVDRAAKEDDYVRVALTASSDGETIYSFTADDDYQLYLNGEEYGEEFDTHIIGKKAGDKEEFSIKYGEDADDSELAGKTVDFTVEVLSVVEEDAPELTEDFIKNELGYDSEEAMREEIRKQLEEENAKETESEYGDSVMAAYIDLCTFPSYDEDIYNAYYDQVVAGYEEYTEMFGASSVEEIYEFFGMTEDDVKQEALDALYRQMVVEALSSEEGIEVTDEDYQAALEKYTEENEYDSTDALLAEYDEETIRNWALDDLVVEFLKDHCTPVDITDADEATEDEDISE